MDYKVVTSRNASGLTKIVNEAIANGWTPVGGHKVVEVHRQNRFSGTQLKDTVIEVEYSQTLKL